jgi:hypothetical protein
MEGQVTHEHDWSWDRKKRAYVCRCGNTDRPAKGQNFEAWMKAIKPDDLGAGTGI